MRTAPRDPEGRPGAQPACGPGGPGRGQQLGVNSGQALASTWPHDGRGASRRHLPQPWGGRVTVRGTLRRDAETFLGGRLWSVWPHGKQSPCVIPPQCAHAHVQNSKGQITST